MPARKSIAIFIATLTVALASAAATLGADATPGQTDGATLEAIAALAGNTFTE